MRIRMLIGVAAVLLMAVSMGFAEGEEKPWFDMEKCAYCVHMNTEEGLMTEYYDLKNGVLGVTTVEEEYMPAMMRVSEKMEKTSQSLMESGETPYMCGHCEAYGGFMMAGVMPEEVMASAGLITVWTAEDPEMVAKLQAFAKKTNDEMAKWHADKADMK